MTARIEKTVFISYRRTNLPWALNIYQNLTHHGYDVFFDYHTINSGNFEKIIVENIKARVHFLIILTPSALEKCKEPNDWLRREIETAIDERRNIIPLMLESFDFGSPSVVQALTGKLSAFNKYNGLSIPSEYFLEAMDKLRPRYLNIALENIPLHTLSEEVKEITKVQKVAASEALPVDREELTAQEWFERGYKYTSWKTYNLDEAIHCFSEAIYLNPNYAEAYNSRAELRRYNRDLKGAFEDCDKAIQLKPDYAEAYNNRGLIYSEKGDFNNAIKDFIQAIRIKPDFRIAQTNLSIAEDDKRGLNGSSLKPEGGGPDM